VELWIATTSHTTAYLFVTGFVQCGVTFKDNGTIDFEVGDGNNWSDSAVSTHVVNDGLWHYVAGTYDGANVRVFIDGQADGSAAYSGTIGTITYPTVVGGRPFNQFFTGTLDEVRLSSVARSGSEIANNWADLSTVCPEPSACAASAGAISVLLAISRARRARIG